MSATNQLKEILQMPGFLTTMAGSQNLMSVNPFNSMSELNDLNTCLPTNTATIRHNLPNNCTIRVNASSTKTLFTINALKVAIEGHESTNSDFTKIERLVDFNWEQNRNANWIAVNNRKPLMAYVLNRFTRPATKTSNVSMGENLNNQMIRVMNYETRHRCLAKGVFHEPIADLSFAVNSVSSNSLDISKLAVADFGGNLYIYSLKEENGEIQANQVLAINNDGQKFESVRISWCPYIPSEDDDTELEGDPGLTLALSCDNRIELFAIDMLQMRYKESIVIEVSALRASKEGYQLIENAHDMHITSMSIAQEVTAICTAGLDDKIRFFSVSLNSSEDPNQKVFLKEWNLRNEYQYYEREDHINNFFFLDDFDFLLSQSDPIFWGYGLLCTRKGHIAVINLKDWRPKQCIRLNNEESSDSVHEEFSYRMDLTAHHVLAIKGHDAFLLHIRFPHDKEEVYDECDPITNESNFDNTYPYISKVTRFQLYSASLRSFTIKKAIDDNVLIFWITGQSLEVCHLDLSLITVEEILPSYEMPSLTKMLDNIGDSSALNNINNDSMTASNIPNKDMDLMGDVSQINGFDGFDISLIKPMNATIDTSILSLPQTVSIPIHQTSDPVSSLNLLPIPPPPPPTFTQNKAFKSGPTLPRPESPASKEVQQIFSPSLATMANTNALKTMLSLNSNNSSVQSFRNEEPNIGSFDSLGALFPSKLPNMLKGIVKEEQILQLKTELSKEIQDSESRVIQTIDKLDHKLNAKLNSNNEYLVNNSKVQTNKIENDLKDMKKELKNACKIRNEEFNKIVEKLVNRVMHEMNLIVQKGFTELMENVNKEIKVVTKDFEKQIQTMQTKISQSIDKNSQFQPLALAPPGSAATPSTPLTPYQTQPQQPSLYSQTPTLMSQRRTPQPVMNSTPQSVSTTPLPFPTTPRSAYQTPNESQMSALEQSWQQNEQQKQLLAKKQRQQIQNEIWKCVGTGQLDQAIIKALNMKDPDMVVNICEIFKDNPSQLIEKIKADQLVLISLLQQIIYHNNNNLMEDSYWKTGFIEQIMTNLDLQNEFVIKILPGLAPKLIQQLDIITNSGAGPLADKAKILAFTFKHLRF